MRYRNPYSLVVLSLLAAVSLCALLSSPAEAGRSAFGIRGGITSDPDTGFFGIHGAIHPSGARMLRIEPSFEAGFGENLDFTLRFNLNFKFMVSLGQNAAVYPLFGPSVYHIDFDGGGDATDFGVVLGGGFAVSRFLFDLAIGIPDEMPDLTFTIGYTFW